MTQTILVIPSGVNRSEGGVTCKVRSDETNNQYTVLELVLPPGQGPAWHVHYYEDEIMTVMEGELEVLYGETVQKVQSGAVIVLPKNQPHTFRNSGSTPNRVLITAIPGGLDRYFEELYALAARQATQEEFDVINERYGVITLPTP